MTEALLVRIHHDEIKSLVALGREAGIMGGDSRELFEDLMISDPDAFEFVVALESDLNDRINIASDRFALAWMSDARDNAYRLMRSNARGMTPISYLETIRSLEGLDAPTVERWDPLDEFSIHEAGSNAPPNMIEEHHE